MHEELHRRPLFAHWQLRNAFTRWPARQGLSPRWGRGGRRPHRDPAPTPPPRGPSVVGISTSRLAVMAVSYDGHSRVFWTATQWLAQKVSPAALGIHACGELSQVFLRWSAEKVRHLTIVHVIGAGAGCSRVAAGRLCGGASRLRPPPPRLLFPAAACCLHPASCHRRCQPPARKCWLA